MLTARKSVVLLLSIGLLLGLGAQALAVPYSSLVLADNPHGYWRLGEGAGTTAYDQVGFPSGENGTYQNGPTLGISGISGTSPNTAVNFDGTNDRVRIVDPHDPTDYSLEAWIKLDSLPSSWSNILWRTNSGENNSFSHILQVNNQGMLRHYTWDGAARYVDSTTLVQPGDWYHVVGLYHPGPTGVGFMSIYVNGGLEGHWAANPMNNPWAGGDRWLLADSHQALPNLNGTIDEVAIYHSLLGAAAIEAHYQAGIVLVPEPAALAIWGLGLLGLVWYARRKRN